MSEFKITHETTLYELQEYCRDNKNCDTCCLKDDDYVCRFAGNSPNVWNITKPKTYKEDFLEKFPNAGLPCRVLVYFGTNGDCTHNFNCEECWNETMKEVENEDL